MPKEIMKCKVCGKDYIACRTPNLTGIFRWRDVACSVECGQVWLERIERSRSKLSQEPVAEPMQETVQDSIREAVQESMPEVIQDSIQEVNLVLVEKDNSEPTE